MERELDYYEGRDLGDENDFDPHKREPLQGHFEGVIDAVFAEQINISLRVMLEADTLPPDLVEHHRKVLEYWGVFEKQDETMSQM